MFFLLKNGILLYKRGEVLLRKCYLCGIIEKEKEMHPLELFKFCPKCGSSAFVENNEKSKRCDECGFVYYFNASSATVAFILNEKQELLVCRRAKEPAKGTLDL